MDKYIHIEDLKDYLNRQIQAFEPCPDKYDAAVGIYNGLYRIPTADVAPVIHGILKYSPQDDIALCSKCGEEIYLGALHQFAHNYCPNCGAKLEGEENG